MLTPYKIAARCGKGKEVARPVGALRVGTAERTEQISFTRKDVETREVIRPAYEITDDENERICKSKVRPLMLCSSNLRTQKQWSDELPP